MKTVTAAEWIGQPYWNSAVMRVWAASEYNSGYTASQTVAGYAGTLVGDLHNNDGSGYGMWLSFVGGGTNPSPSGSVGKTWIAFDFGVSYLLDTMWVWNYNQSGYTSRGFRNVTIEYSEDYVHWTKLGDYEFAQALGTANMPHNIEVNFGGSKARFVVITAKTTNGNWGNVYYGLSEVRFYGTSSGIPIRPSPTDGQQCTDIGTLLGWTDDPNIVSYDVYFGTDLNEVSNTTRLRGDVNGDGKVDFMDIAELALWWLSSNNSPGTIDLVSDGKVNFADYAIVAEDFGKFCGEAFKGNVDVNSFDPGGLAQNQTYYWRIDKITQDGVYKDIVWSFTTCYNNVNSEYYLATDGNDSNPGTIDQPFRTLEKARDTLVCACLPPSGATVYLRGGKYFRTNEFQLSAQNSGKPGKPITYRAYPGEEVRIIGGVQLPSSWFTLVTSSSPVWSRIPTFARFQIYQCDLASHGVTNYGSPGDDYDRPDISFNGQIMQLARWPNNGFAPIVSTSSNTTFTYSGTEPSKWSAAPERWAAGYWNYGWHYAYQPISSINTSTKTITLAGVPGYGILAGGEWCAINLLEELDSAGEWYLERNTGILYFWPPSDISSGEVLFSLIGTPSNCLMEATNAADITFRNITFEMCRFRPIQIIGGKDILIDNCIIRNTGEDGIVISGGERHGVQNSQLYDVGGIGIYLDGGDRRTLKPGNHFACNNNLYRFSRWLRANWPGIQLVNVGNRVEHNRLSYAPHSAIFYHGNNHLIQYNEIDHVCYETDDAGAIMSDRDWGHRGNSIKYNFIHHVDSSSSYTLGVHGIYYDGCTCGHDVFGNVFYQITGNIIFINGGRDNIALNNIIAKCGTAIASCRGGKAWINEISGNSFNLLEKIQAVDYTQPPYSTAYPALAAILSEGYDQAKEPKGNIIQSNIGWSNSAWTYDYCIGGCGAFDYFTFQNNVTNQDPLFIDEANLNLALKANSPAYTIPGFVRIPFEVIGLLSTTKATRPNPSVGLTNVSVQDDVYWAPAFGAAQRDIYFGADVSTVTNATPQSPMGVYKGRQSGLSFDPGVLGAATVYYWRIDEVDSAGNLLGKGDIWSFTTN